ncbi:MAG TPA: DUF4856 domain-containing protein [Chryseosolibacter sp.]|nr:DUF4856 domain-containing protein [Chryseosolibacter sp.]
MAKNLYNPKLLLILAVCGLSSCDNDDETKNLRSSVDYNTLSLTTAYADQFEDADGNSTVNVSDGTNRLKMFQALNSYATSSISADTHIDEAHLMKMFTNTGEPFTDIPSMNIVGADLNATDVQLENSVASSFDDNEAQAVRSKFATWFTDLEEASHALGSSAESGVAGELMNGERSYLVDEDGIEVIQVIQKSLIGALQLDYIGNVLLDEGLTADNSTTVSDENYTQLEHNWDVAYGLLTSNPIYLEGSTDEQRGTSEFGAGSYIWEYNKAHYADFFPAFLEGRAAIVNNDRAKLQENADFIRTEMEKTIANAALGYLGKWKTGANHGARAHAIGEGIGFIYSLRFAKMHNGDAAFSDAILADLLSGDGYWDIDEVKVANAEAAIKEKFDIL